MVEIDNSRLLENFQQWQKVLREDPNKGISTPSVTVTSIRNLESRADIRDKSASWTFYSDEDKARGGESKHPSALGYFLGALGFCQHVWLLKCAAILGLTINSADIEVRSILDLRGEHFLDNIYPGLQYFAIETRIGSSEPEEKIRSLAKLVDSSCPIYNTLNRAAPIKQKLVLNGRIISGEDSHTTP